MHHNKLLHFKYSLYNSKTDPASISKRRASRIPPVPQVSTAQVESGLYFLITNKLNARRWVKTFSLKMVGICICHQSVSVKLSFWLRKLWEEEKKKPKPKKIQERKKSSPQTLATFKTREELNSVDRDASLEAECLQRGWALICELWVRTERENRFRVREKHRIQLWKHQEDKDYWGSDAALNESKEVFLCWMLAQKGD